jgi:hypothetical protein
VVVVSHAQDFGFRLEFGNFGGRDLNADAMAAAQRVNWGRSLDYSFLVVWPTCANACTCTRDCASIHIGILVQVG